MMIALPENAHTSVRPVLRLVKGGAMNTMNDGGPDLETSGQLIDEWVEWMQGRGMAVRTVTERRRLLLHIVAATGEYAGAFTPRAMSLYLTGQAKPGTRGTYHAHLRAFHLWLRKVRRLRDDDPTEDVGRPIVPRRQPHPVADAHMDALMATRMKRRTRTAILLAAYQGLRVHEIAKLRGEDVDLIGGELLVNGKGGVIVRLPLHPAIRAEAETPNLYPRRGWWFPSTTDPAKPITDKNVSTIISQAMKRAGVPGSAHSLRHRFGTELIGAGVDARTTQTLLRHASLATTAIYTGISKEQQRVGIERLAWAGAVGKRRPA